jgi:transaldolase
MNPLLKLIECGQSYWIDNLARSMMKTGELNKRVKEQGLRGMTSNPAIFNNAITKSDDYDDQIKELTKAGKSISEIYERLTVKDVQDACDIMRSVYDESNGLDGYVSLEVSPYLARHTEETMKEAQYLFETVNRPNCMIKIPGTIEGVPAIEQMLYEGVNVNVTLLFSVKSYEEVARAYVRALERRVADNKPIDKVASVASFFISRIDTLVDQLLAHRLLDGTDNESTRKVKQLLGTIAIASGKLAYQSYLKIFSGDLWESLVNKGGRVQRPLWASTSTKNPKYSDIYYVEPFIGQNTVNTLPNETIDAFGDHGKIVKDSVEKDVDESKKDMSTLEEVGIDINYVTQRLEDEGIQKFIEPFDNLLKNLAQKRVQFF